jgi:hypothetical protein
VQNPEIRPNDFVYPIFLVLTFRHRSRKIVFRSHFVLSRSRVIHSRM